jgi:hypothetical protein
MLRLICVAIYILGLLMLLDNFDPISHVDIYPACHCYVELKIYLIAFTFQKDDSCHYSIWVHSISQCPGFPTRISCNLTQYLIAVIYFKLNGSDLTRNFIY